MIRLAVIFAGLVMLLLATFFWSSGRVQARADFTFINRGDVGTLDPNRMSWLQDIRLGYALWEGLYTLDPATLKAIPGSADRIEISEDKTVYTFHIRASARWSNGNAVTPGDFVFAWRRMLEEPGDYTYLFAEIRGAKAYREAFAAHQPADFASVGIEAVDAQTLRVKLNHPVAYFPDMCAFPPFWPLHEPSMRPFFNAKTHSYGKGFTRPPNLVGNGPYRLAAWNFKRNLRLEASDYYWDRANVKSRTINVLNADDPMWGFLQYDTKAIDWLSDASGPIGAELYKNGRRDLHVFPAFGTYFYTINCMAKLPDGRVNPFADVRVRKAFSMAIDRRGIVQTITRLGEPVATTYIPPGVFDGYQSPVATGYDLAQARSLLAEAGYPNGRGFPKVGILFNNESLHADIAQYARRQWLENLNVDVGMEGQEVKIFRQRLHGKDYVLARASWFGDYNDPSTFTDKYRSNSENNDAGWINARYDQLCEQAAVEGDAGRRLRLFEQAEGALLGEQPIIPLYYYVNAYLYSEKVRGLSLNPRNLVMLKSIEVTH